MAPWRRTARRPATRVRSSFRMAGACLPARQAATLRSQSHRRTRAVKQRFAGGLLAVLAAAAMFPVLAAGQRGFQPPAGPAPRTPSGKVDFSGVWQKPYVPDMTKDGQGQTGTAVLPFTPW